MLINLVDILLFICGFCYITLALYPNIKFHPSPYVNGFMSYLNMFIGMCLGALIFHTSDDALYDSVWVLFLGFFTVATATRTFIHIVDVYTNPTQCKRSNKHDTNCKEL